MAAVTPVGSRFSQDRMDRVAAIKRIISEAFADAPRFRFKDFAQRIAWRHVEFDKPSAQRALEPRWQTLLPAKVHDVQRATLLQGAERRIDCASPFRDHGKRVGDEYTIEPVAAKKRIRVEVRSVAARKADARGKAMPADRYARRLQHFVGNIQPAELRVWIGLRRLDQVAPGPAAKLQHAAAGGTASPWIMRSRPSR